MAEAFDGDILAFLKLYDPDAPEYIEGPQLVPETEGYHRRYHECHRCNRYFFTGVWSVSYSTHYRRPWWSSGAPRTDKKIGATIHPTASYCIYTCTECVLTECPIELCHCKGPYSVCRFCEEQKAYNDMATRYFCKDCKELLEEGRKFIQALKQKPQSWQEFYKLVCK